MLLDGPIHTRQAKTCALAVLSSRAERFEQMSLDFRGDAAASVTNRKAHELCRSPSVCAACLRACLRNPLPLLLWRRGPGRGGRFLTRALRSSKIFRHALMIVPANDRGLDSQGSARRHGIARIQNEIYDDVLQHACVGHNRRQVRGMRVFERNRFAHEAVEHRI